MTHQYEQFMHFVDLFRDIIKDKTHDLKEEIQGIYHLLNEKIDALQQQNHKLSESVEAAEAEISKHKDSINQLHGENAMLAALNAETNVKFGEVRKTNKSLLKKYEAILAKIDSADETKSNFNLCKEMDNMKAEQKKFNDNINTHLKTNIEQVENKLKENRNSTDLNIKAMDDKIMAINGQLSHLQTIASQINKYKTHSYTWKISGIGKILKQKTFAIESEEFPVAGYPFKAKAKFLVKMDGNAYVSLAFVDENNRRKQVPFKVIPRYTYTLKNLKDNEQDFVRPVEHLFAAALKFHHFHHEKLLKKKSELENSTYIQNDFIVIDIAIEPPSVANATATYEGILTCPIDHYKWRKQRDIDDLERSHQSPYFYTSNGLRANVDMYLNGLNSYAGKGLTAQIEFLTGENDANLSPSFAHKTTIIVFNQMDPTKHYQKTIDSDIKHNREYFVDLLPHNNIENDGFLKNDTLYYKVVIQPL